MINMRLGPVIRPEHERVQATRRARHRARVPVRDDDRGSSGVEFVILFPLIIALLFAGPQIAMWYFARETAQAAALAGARAASADGAPTGTGQTAATTYLDKVGTDTITSYIVTENDTPTSITIHIHATVPNVIPLPGFAPTVDVTIVRARERFTTPDTP
jgi:Flp pilus assembly protein TadG